MSDGHGKTGYALTQDELSELGGGPREHLSELVSGEYEYVIEDEPLSAPPTRASGIAPAPPMYRLEDTLDEDRDSLMQQASVGPVYAKHEDSVVFALDFGPDDEEDF